MVPLDDPTAGRPAPVLAERKVEARAAQTATETAISIRLARRRGDLPAGRRRARHRCCAMADEQAQAGVLRAQPFARGERKTARRGEIGRFAFAGELGDDAGERAAAQRLLHRPEHIDRLRHAEHEEARRGKTEQVEAGTVRRPALAPRVIGGDPEHGPAVPTGARRNRYGKPAGRREMHGCRGSKLVQRAAGEPAAEDGVDRRTKPDEALLPGEAGGAARVDPRQDLAKMVQRRLWRGRAHGNPLCSCFVLNLPHPPRDVKRAGAK